MARITVEDCLPYVKNRFDLVLKASERAKLLELGGDAKVPWENDKPTVVALREIAKGYSDNKSVKEEQVEEQVSDIEGTQDVEKED